MAQIITSKGGGGGGGGASYTAGNGIDITNNEISIDTSVVAEKTDLSGFQTVGNMVDNLTGADDDHYPTAKAVADAISGGGSGNVVGPASSTDEDVAVFDGVTGKIIKDSGVKLSSKLDASALSDNNYGGAWENDSTHTPTKRALYDKIHTMDVEIGNKAADTAVVKLTGNQTINGTKTFSTSPVVPSKTTDATNTGTAIATEAQVYNVAEDVATINGMISSNASSSNKLMDKNYIDDSINSVTAYYITKNAQGDQWATYAELSAATTFYSGGVQRTPTKNDYTIVLDDENHDNATTRYIYNSGWEYQYTVNETALTQAQLDALNSGITSGKVSTYDGYATEISGKQDALTLPATPTQGNLVVRGANNKTLADGGAIPTVPTDVSAFNNDAGYITGSSISDTAFGASWDGDTTHAPSKNAVYDKIETMCVVPAGGTCGQVLTKTDSGCGWADASGGGGGCYADVFLVGGGGGGGAGQKGSGYYGGSGGGGGAVIECHRYPITSASSCVQVGSGGNGGPADNCGKPGCNGGTSRFATLCAYGGGGGGGGCWTINCVCTLNGGNLGGYANCANTLNTGGHKGGNNYRSGGGGAGGDGENTPTDASGNTKYCKGGDGGPGIYSAFSGGYGCYGGGGGGAGSCTTNFGYGRGGGGNGGCYGDGCNAGGHGAGGGGGKGECNYCYAGGKGSAGIVYIRYPSNGSYGFTCATGGTKSTATVNGLTYCVHKFTSNGTFTIVS